MRVLLFAAFREAIGRRQIELSLPTGATPDDVFNSVAAQASGVANLRPFTTFAVNREVVSADTRLSDGDEIAFLQPASGGD